jgi:CelD/BcsL family acetyltransferase involved in cellulose biosynthesis
MRISKVPIDDPRWREFTSSQADASPFHLPSWTSVISDCYHFDPFVLAALDADGEILAGAPTVAVRSPFGRLRWVSLPFSDYTPLLVRPDADEADFVEALREYVLAGPARELEVRASLPQAENLYPVDVGYIHRLELPRDPADLHPHKSQRENRNRALRMGVQVTRGSGPEDIARFYRLHTLTRRRHGVPVQPRRFFDLLQDRLLARGNGLVATASLDGRVLAAGVYLQHNGTLVAKYHASDPTLPFAGAGHLIEWEMMVYGCTEGFRTLDVGRTDPGAEGLREYKSGWGAVESPLAYTHISRTPASGEHVSVGELPKRIIRNSPLWVCRALGEALYRWTA